MAVIKNVPPRIAHPDRLFIGGEWVVPSDGGSIEIVSPDTERAVMRTAAAGPLDMDRAVHDAAQASDEGVWSRTPPAQRAHLLTRLADALRAREAELCGAWTMQVGGLVSIAGHATEIGHANLLNAARVGAQIQFEEEVPTALAARGLLVREPVGVVATIAPWNAPYMLMTGKIGPALMAGCSVIMKPSPETPLEAYIIAECAEAVGFPKGVINLVPADRDASDHLIRNPGVDKVSFTGSTVVGRRVATVCAERFARCTLELGGKSAAIVLDDFPLPEAAKLLTQTITLLSGQICAMLSRVIVPRSRHDALADAIATEMRNVRVGHSTEVESQMGPLASRRQFERVKDYIQKGKDGGAKLVTGGGRPPALKTGFFLEPTLFADVDRAAAVAQEEIFGPVLTLIPCEDTQDAIRIANDSKYGLHGSVLTHDPDAAYAIGRRVKVGSFAQNGMKTDFSMPLGGVKQSGLGREGGVEGLMAYLETKAIVLDAPVSK